MSYGRFIGTNVYFKDDVADNILKILKRVLWENIQTT
jgi:hypothetical protein